MRQIVFRPILSASLGLALLAGSVYAQGVRTPPARSVLEELFYRPVPSPYCNAWPARAHVGRQATPAVVEQARVAAGAAIVWTIEPGTGINGNFVEGRLLLDLDAGGTIVSAHCA